MPNEFNHPYQIPQLTIQSDWTEVVSDVNRGNVASESFWVSCYKKGASSIHGSVLVTRSNSDPSAVEYTGKDGISVERISNYSLYVSCEAAELSNVVIKGARATFKKLHSGSITAVDISPGGGLFLTGDNKGLIVVGDTSDGSVRRELKGHVADINTCRFFPSGKVVLSGSADLQLRIWSALDGSNPVTLKGHTKGVTDTAIIDRGRNVLSSSRDGTIKLWECGSSSTISTMGKYECEINKISLGVFSSESNFTRDLDYQLDPREVETQDKLVVGVLENGGLFGIDLRSKNQVFAAKSYRDIALEACDYAPLSNLIVVGSTEGVIEVFDPRNISKNLFSVQRNDSRINDLQFIEGSSDLLVCQADGSAFQLSLSSGLSITQATHEYTGFDLDSVNAIRSADKGKQIYAVGRDGSLRKY